VAGGAFSELSDVSLHLLAGDIVVVRPGRNFRMRRAVAGFALVLPVL